VEEFFKLNSRSQISGLQEGLDSWKICSAPYNSQIVHVYFCV